jgi:hypothetical protein
MATYKVLNDDGSEKLIHVVKVRVTETDMKTWRAAARADHRDLADWIRMRCNGLSASPPPNPLSLRPTPLTDKVVRARATRLGAARKKGRK